LKAMILAAGRGTRMQPLTYALPKPMIPILGKPVMEYLVELLSRHGFDQIMINVGHLANRIENYFGNGQRWGVEIGYSFEGHIEQGQVVAEPVGSAGGLKRIQDFSHFFDDTLLVVCGDALIDLDMTAALRKHWQSGALASLVVSAVPDHRLSDYGVVVYDKTGRVESFQEKPAPGEAHSNQVNTGIYIFEPAVLDLIPPACSYDIGSQLFPKILAEGLHLQAIRMAFNWVDIGRLNDYWEASQQLMRGQVQNITMPGTNVRPGVWTGLNVKADWDALDIEGPVYIGSSSSIESGTRIIGPCWIDQGCYVKSGAQISRSILFGYTQVGSAALLRDCVVFGRFCVDKHGHPLTSVTQTDWVTDARIR